jgi:branched-chain amino acid transport system permease protein
VRLSPPQSGGPAGSGAGGQEAAGSGAGGQGAAASAPTAAAHHARGGARAWAAGALLIAAALLALAPVFSGDYAQQVSFRIFEYAALGQAWNLLAGYGGLVSLGSAAFIGIGEYTTAELTNHGLPLVPGMLVSGAFAAAFATIVSPALFRLRGLYFTIGTLALAEALRLFMVNYNGLGGNIGVLLESAAPTTAGLYWLSLGVAAAATGLVLLVLRTRLTISLRAVRDDEDVARQMGLWSFRTKLFAFTFAAFLMGVAGGLQAGKLSHIEPYGAFGLQWTVDIVTVVLIGGLGTTGGPLVGAVFMVALAELLSGSPSLHLAITGAIVVAVVRFAPHGLWGVASRAAAHWGSGGRKSEAKGGAPQSEAEPSVRPSVDAGSGGLASEAMAGVPGPPSRAERSPPADRRAGRAP